MEIPLLVIQEVLASAKVLEDAADKAQPQQEQTRQQQEDPGLAQSLHSPSGSSRPNEHRASSDASATPRSSEQKQSSSSGPAQAKSSMKADTAAQKCAKVGVELEGLRIIFSAEAVFAALQIAADVTAVQDSLRPTETAPHPTASAIEQPGTTSMANEASTPKAASAKLSRRDSLAAVKWRATVAAATGKTVSAQGYTPRRHPPSKPRLDIRFDACLSDMQAEMWLSDQVTWGMHIASFAASYAARCAVIEGVTLLLNHAPLIRLGAAVAAGHLPGFLEEAAPLSSPWVILGKPEAAAAARLGRALVGGSLVEASPVAEEAAEGEHLVGLESASQMGSIITDVTFDDDARTLSRQDTSMSSRWQEIADMGSASEAGDASPLRLEEGTPERAGPRPQRPFGAGLERLGAAYQRAGLPNWADDLNKPADAQVCTILVKHLLKLDGCKIPFPGDAGGPNCFPIGINQCS